MGQWTFLELARKVLQDEQKPLTPEEIWAAAQARGYQKNVTSQGLTPWRTIGAQIYVSIRDHQDSPFVKVESSPRRFYLRELMRPGDETKLAAEVQELKEHPKKFEFLEKDLHPFLSYFGYNYLHANLKTIDHTKSGKKEYSEWTHPDMVGFYYPLADWKSEVLDLSQTVGSISVRLFSFEIKRALSFGNLRESFFQAVSNSSWANEGYLVAAQIEKTDDFADELKRLSTSFGIGVIELVLENPDDASIQFPAKQKTDLDWETINKMASINPDFRGFLTRIKKDVATKEVRREEYDKVYSKDELLKRLTPPKHPRKGKNQLFYES